MTEVPTANQWIGFYMIGTSVMKEFMKKLYLLLTKKAEFHSSHRLAKLKLFDLLLV